MTSDYSAPFKETFPNYNKIPFGWSTYNSLNSSGHTNAFKFSGLPAYDSDTIEDHSNIQGSRFAWVDGSSSDATNQGIVVSLEIDTINISALKGVVLDFQLWSFNVTFDTSGYNTL